MDFLGFLITSAALAAVWTWLWRNYYRCQTRQSETHFVSTADGWRIALHRYGTGRPSHLHPVILCHGLGANRFSFDLEPEVSLACKLAEEGYDTWVLELRGQGMSERPALFGKKRYNWSFHDYLLHDLPAAIAHVREVTGAPKVHWIGHSMGGLLLLSHLARVGDDDIQSAITIGSSLDYSGSGSEFKQLAKAKRLLSVVAAIPLGPVSAFLAPFSCRVPNPIDAFNVYFDNIEGHLHRKLAANTFHAIPSAVLEDLATAMETGGLCAPLKPGDEPFHYIANLGKTRVPVLLTTGDRDLQCPPQATEVSFVALGSVDKKLVVFGTENGQAEHYGHFDLIVGKRAPAETWPVYVAWLDRHD